jgi:hypothetical protein
MEESETKRKRSEGRMKRWCWECRRFEIQKVWRSQRRLRLGIYLYIYKVPSDKYFEYAPAYRLLTRYLYSILSIILFDLINPLVLLIYSGIDEFVAS